VRRGAEILVRDCARVRSGEVAVVVADQKMVSIAEAVADAALRAGARATVAVAPPRRIDNEEPSPFIAASMVEADVVFLAVSCALAHTRATRSAIEAGARVLSMTAFTERMMREGGLFADFEVLRPRCLQLAEWLSQAEQLHVSNPSGTDLTFSVRGRMGNAHCCILEEPGFTAVPNVEANISPVEGTAEGTMVVDGSIPYYGIGVIRDPITCRIRNGFVESISGGDQGRFLKRLLASRNDPCVYNVAQFAVGLNPECGELTGEMLNDEGVAGTVHFGIGTSANLGGRVRASTHFDAILRSPTILLDGQLLPIQ
jgi:leucyl aminopeptidase (aminopeptidase T)